MPPILSVETIVKRYGGVAAIDKCSLSVPRASITGLIGPNGAGKTTLFNIIAGATTPDAGRVRFDGTDVTGLPTHALFRRGIVRTFQIPHAYARMTVVENLMVVPPGQSGERLAAAWFRPRAVAREDRSVWRLACEVLDILDLAELRDAPAGLLSGGQKKLLELGRTMMVDARLVLLDEPAAGVNRTLLGQLAGHIERRHRSQGTTFLIIEHDMDLVTRLCDPVVVMAQGRVLATGDIASVKADAAVRDAYLGEPVAAAPP